MRIVRYANGKKIDKKEIKNGRISSNVISGIIDEKIKK